MNHHHLVRLIETLLDEDCGVTYDECLDRLEDAGLLNADPGDVAAAVYHYGQSKGCEIVGAPPYSGGLTLDEESDTVQQLFAALDRGDVFETSFTGGMACTGPFKRKRKPKKHVMERETFRGDWDENGDEDDGSNEWPDTLEEWANQYGENNIVAFIYNRHTSRFNPTDAGLDDAVNAAYWDKVEPETIVDDLKTVARYGDLDQYFRL